MRDSRRKTAFVVTCTVKGLCARFSPCVLATLTFEENLTDLIEAKRRWHNLSRKIGRTCLARHPLEFVGVWERQKRGAWHLHVVCNQYIDVVWLRDEAVSCGFGRMMRLDYLRDRKPNEGGFRGGKSTNGAAAYLCKYLLKDLGDDSSGLGLVTYGGGRHVKKGSVRFHWAGWQRALAVKGLSFLSEMALHDPDEARMWGWSPGRRAAWPLVVRIGMELLTPAERSDLALRFDGFARYCCGPPGPENEIEPF